MSLSDCLAGWRINIILYYLAYGRIQWVVEVVGKVRLYNLLIFM